MCGEKEMTQREKQAYIKLYNDSLRKEAVEKGLILAVYDPIKQVKIHNFRKIKQEGKDYFAIKSYTGGLLCFAYTKEMIQEFEEISEVYVSGEKQSMIDDIYYELVDRFGDDKKLSNAMFYNGFTMGYKNNVDLRGFIKFDISRVKRRSYELVYKSLSDFSDWLYEYERNGFDPIKQRCEFAKERAKTWGCWEHSNWVKPDNFNAETTTSCEAN